jgi:hypothetical protein
MNNNIQPPAPVPRTSFPSWASKGTKPEDAIRNWVKLRIALVTGAFALFGGFLVTVGFSRGKIGFVSFCLFATILFSVFFYCVSFYRRNASKIKEAYKKVYTINKQGNVVLLTTGMDSNTISQYNNIRRSSPLIVYQ